MGHWMKIVIVGVSVACAWTGSADVITDWNATLRQVMQSDGLKPENRSNPGWATRTLAMMNGAIYDTFQAVERTHDPFLVDAVAGPGTSLPAAVHRAAYDVMRHTYPGELPLIDAAFNARIAAVPDGSAKTNGITLGAQIAQQYIDARANDHADEMVLYTPQSGPGKWRPDPFHPDQEAWGPGWRDVQPFAIGDTQPFVNALPPIPALTRDEYADAFQMVKEYGAIDSAVRSDDQKKMGHFWAYDRGGMGPPPVMFSRSLSSIAEQAGNDESDNARLFAMASVAMADAAIASWDTKFEANLWRPVAAIHEADTDGNPDTVADPDWRPLGAPGPDPDSFEDDFTPPFPAWTSGHATMGAALFKSLELFYGTNVFDEIDGVLGDDPLYALTSQEGGSGTERQYATFTQTSPLGIGSEDSPEGENAMSRIYLGIHWIFDQTDGIALGHDIADYINGQHFQVIPEPGTATLLGLAACAALRRRRA